MQSEELDDQTQFDQSKAIRASHKDSITLEILQIIKEAQNAHGLKHGDYQRYRSYCARRLRRIRKSLNFVQASGSKNRATFQLKKITNELVFEASKSKKDPIRYLYIPLMEAERSWGYAMALKQEANTEPRKRFHLQRKLRKAVKHAQELDKLCNDQPTKCDARTKLESQAYFAYMNGIYLFETERWAKASEYMKKAQAIYTKLCQAIKDDEVSIHYRHRIDELKPSLRYCAFNIGETGVGAQDLIDTMKQDIDVEDEILASKLDQLIFQTREKQAVTLSEIKWMGKIIAVKHEKIRAFLLSLQELKGSPEPTKVSKWEKMLFECRDCIQLMRDSNQEKTPLYCYLQYLRLHLTSKRNVQMIKNIQNQTELIRPYEILIGVLSEMKSLPYDQYFQDDELIESFINETEAIMMAYKAFRCYYIGKAGKLEWKQSLALLYRAGQYCDQCLDNKHLDKEMKEKVKELKSKCEVDKFDVYGNALMVEPESSKDKEKKPLIDRLNEWCIDSDITPGNPNLVDFPPKFRPIPCKPLFFDLALNHIEFPNLEEEMANTKGGGITGFVKGWLWRK